MGRKALKLFVLDHHKHLGDALADRLGLGVSPFELRLFDDGEQKIRPLCSVRGSDVYVLMSCLSDEASSTHDQLMRLLFFVGALRDAGAARVTVVAPYLCYARKDRKTKPSDPTSIQYVARMMESLGVQGVVTIDVHNIAAFHSAFRMPTEHLEAGPLLVQAMKEHVGAYPITVMSPDLGGIKRAQHFRDILAQKIGLPPSFAVVYKERSQDVVTTGDIFGPVKDHDVIIVDDMIATGTTMQRSAALCLEQGAKRVFVAATHGVFTSKAKSVLLHQAFHHVFVTSTVAAPLTYSGSDPELRDKLTVVDVSPLLAHAITEWHGAMPLDLA